MAKSIVNMTDLMKYYYVQEKTLNEIATIFGLNSDEAVRYHLRKKENGKEIMKNRDRDYTTADHHAMIQTFNDMAVGEKFDHDMALISILTQSRMSEVTKELKPLWESKYGKAYSQHVIEEIDKQEGATSVVQSSSILSAKLWHLSENSKTPKYSARPGGGLALHATEQLFLRSGEPRLTSIGLAVDIPAGLVGLVVSDPTLVNSNDIVVVGSPLIIAPGDNNEIKVKLLNAGKGAGSTMYTIGVGQVVARLVFVESPLVVWNEQ